MNPKHIVAKMQKDYRIIHPTLDDICRIITDQGYDIIDFDPNDKSEAISLLSQELGLSAQIMAQDAFVVENNRIRLMFVRDSLTVDEKLIAMVHELGHILCGHMRDGSHLPSITEEYQANEFTHYVLNPTILSRIEITLLRHTKLSLIIFAALLLLILGSVATQQVQVRASYYGDYYVTQSGNKYHVATCYIIKNKVGVRHLTTEEYESGAYEPCSVCIK